MRSNEKVSNFHILGRRRLESPDPFVKRLANAAIDKRMTKELKNTPAYFAYVSLSEAQHVPNPQKTKLQLETKALPSSKD